MEPTTYRPMLAYSAVRPPEGADWLHQVKLNGIRCLAFVDGSKVRLYGRRDGAPPPDITHRFPEIELLCRYARAVFDGEIIVVEKGRPNLHSVQERKTDDRLAIRVLSEMKPAEYHVFDILYCDGDVRAETLEARQALLDKALVRGNNCYKVPSFEDGQDLWRRVQKANYEGVMSKRRTSRYESGTRSRHWLKVKVDRTS